MARGAPLLAALLVATPAVAGEAPSKVAPARLTAARALGDPIMRASALQAVVMRQARDAGVSAALRTVAGVVDEPVKSAALIGVARVQVERGDGAAAWATLGHASSP